MWSPTTRSYRSSFPRTVNFLRSGDYGFDVHSVPPVLSMGTIQKHSIYMCWMHGRIFVWNDEYVGEWVNEWMDG